MTQEIKFYPDKVVGGIQGWNWISYDTGAWDGPKKDWEDHHYSNISKYVGRFGTVVQAGGNQGMYPRLLSRMFDRVYTFEPDPLNFKTLVTNCDQNNIIKIQAALGMEFNTCDISIMARNNTGMHKVNLNSTNGIIPVIPLDIMSDMFTTIDLIMLDLEGFEYNALQGMIDILDQFKPILFIERPGSDIKDLLNNIGYKFKAQSAMDQIFAID